MTLPRLERWTGFACMGGARCSTGGFLQPSEWSVTRSLVNEDQMLFTIPGTAEAAALIAQREVARLWRSDSDFEEWSIGQIVGSRDVGADVRVIARPPLYLLGTHGVVEDPTVTPANGIPATAFGASQITMAELIETYIVDNTSVTDALGIVLTLGTIDPTTTFDLDVNSVSALALIQAGLAALGSLGVLAELPPLRRVGTSSYAIDIPFTVGSTAPKTYVRVGKNLQSLKRTLDDSDRYSRLSAKTAPLSDGSPTVLGLSRWTITNVSGADLTLADPAGGAGPIGFDGQFVTTSPMYVYVEGIGAFRQITGSSASAQTVTVASAASITAGMVVQFRRDNLGSVPYYLDHPTYVAPTAPGIGVVAGQIDRSTVQSVPNLIPNADKRTWSDTAKLPDGWTYCASFGLTSSVLTNDPSTTSGNLIASRNTDPLFRKYSAASLHFQIKAGSLVSPPVKFPPSYSGQRVSLAISMLLVDGWDATANQAAQITAYLGILKGDGHLVAWRETEKTINLQPGTFSSAPFKQYPSGVFGQLVIQELDITVPSTAFFTNVTSGDISDLAGSAQGLVAIIEFRPSTFALTGFSAGDGIEGYLDVVSLNPEDVPPDTLSPFGDANSVHQAVNVALGLVAPPQASYEVSVVDLKRLTPTLTDADFVMGGPCAVFDIDLGISFDTQRVVEISQNQLVEGDTKLTLANIKRRLIDLLFQGNQSTDAKLASLAAASGKSTVPSGGGGTGGSLAAPIVSLSLDGSNVPTGVVMVPPTIITIFVATSTSGQPTAADALAGTEIDAPADYTFSDSALAAGATEYATVVGEDALGQHTPAGIAHIQAPLTEPGTLNPDIPPFALFGDGGAWQMEDRFEWDDSLEYLTGGSTRNGNDARQTRHRTTNSPGFGPGLTDFGLVTWIDLQGATIPSDGLLLLQTSDHDSFTPSLFFWIDGDYALHAGRSDNAGDVDLVSSSNNALPSTGGGWLELVGRIDGSAGAAIAYYTPSGGSRTLLFDNRALNTQSDNNLLGTVSHFYLGNDSWTDTVGATNPTTVILFSDEHWLDRTGISLDDVYGRACVSTMFPAGNGHYADVPCTFNSFNGEDFEGDYEAIDFLSDGTKVSFALPTLDAGIGQVNGLMPFFAVRPSLTNDTTPVCKVGVRSGTTDSESASIDVPNFTIAAGKYYAYIFDGTDDVLGRFYQGTDPNTSARWTLTGAQNAEVMFDCVTAGNGLLLAQLGVDVSCYAAAATSGPGTKVGSREIPYHIISGGSLDYGGQANEIYARFNSARPLPVDVATTAALPSSTYSNGSSGVGATITATATGTLMIDTHLVALNDYILVKNEGAFERNGVYKCTTAGAVGVAFVLTRAVEFDEIAELVGRFIYVNSGSTNIRTKWKCSNDFSHIIGTSPIDFGSSAVAFGDLIGASGTDSSAGANLRSRFGDIDIEIDLKSPASSGDGIGDDFSLLEGGEADSQGANYFVSRSREVYQAMWFDLNSSSISTELGLFRVFGGFSGLAGTTEQCRLSLNSSLQFVVTRRDSSPHTLATSSATCPTSGRVGIAWRVRINEQDSTGGDSWVKVWLTTSGPTTRTLIIDTEGTAQPVRANGIGNTCRGVGFFGVYGSTTDGALATFDDPIVANPGTVAKNTPMDNGRWGTLKPNAAGTYTDSTAHDYTKVQSGDWTAPSDTNHNIFTAANKKDTYNVDAVAGDASVIQGIYPYALVSLPQPPTGTKESGRQCLIIGGDLSKGPKRLVNLAWPAGNSMLTTRMAKSRSAATGTLFSTSELGGAEVGWETLSHTNDDTWLRAVGIDYFYNWTI